MLVGRGQGSPAMTSSDDQTNGGGWNDVITVDIDGEPVEYYPAGVEIPATRVADLAGYEYRYDTLLAHHPRLRRAVVQLRLAKDVHRRFGALRWDDGSDLDQLDRGLAPGTSADARAAAEAVLENALFVVPLDVTCRNCHNSAV